MPMRMPFTPALPTVMWLCPVAMTVPGSSSTRRVGESAVVTLGATTPRAVISTRISSVPRTTFTRCSSFRWPAGCDAGVSAAEAISPNTSNGRNTLSNCFRISLLPNPRDLARVSFLNSIFSALRFSRWRRRLLLNCRRCNPLYHFARERFAQFVLHRFLEHYRVSRDSHHEAVEHRIALVQEISLVQTVGHDRDEAALRLHHASHIDLSDLEALLAGRAT